MTAWLKIVGLALLLGGCVTMEHFQRDMDSRLGWDLDRLRAHFGYNYIERDLGEGLRAYTWTWAEQSLRPGYVSPDVIHTYRSAQGDTRVIISPGSYFPPDYYAYACEMTYILDAAGHAIAWRAHGNGCAVYPGPENVRQHGFGTDGRPLPR